MVGVGGAGVVDVELVGPESINMGSTAGYMDDSCAF